MQRKNNIVLRLHRQRRPEQVLLPIVLEDNGEALRVILEKQDNVTAEFLHKTEKKVIASGRISVSTSKITGNSSSRLSLLRIHKETRKLLLQGILCVCARMRF